MPTAEEIKQVFPEMASRLIPEKAEGLNVVIQFDLSGDNGGLFWLNVADGQCEAGEGQSEDPKMTLRSTADDYYAVVTGSMNAMQAFMSGKIKIEGDMSLAMKMQSMFR